MGKNDTSKVQEQQDKVVKQTQGTGRYAVSGYLEKLKFTPRFMGVDEADVWKKIEKICELYEAALAEERGKSEKMARLLKASGAKLKAYVNAGKGTGQKKADEEAQPNG